MNENYDWMSWHYPDFFQTGFLSVNEFRESMERKFERDRKRDRFVRTMMEMARAHEPFVKRETPVPQQVSDDGFGGQDLGGCPDITTTGEVLDL